MFQTLLHEMIHAYLFVTNNDKDREGHGPEFCKHMHRINRLTGANITVRAPAPASLTPPGPRGGTGEKRLLSLRVPSELEA